MGEQPGVGETETVLGGRGGPGGQDDAPHWPGSVSHHPDTLPGADAEEGDGEEDAGLLVKGRGWRFHKTHETSRVGFSLQLLRLRKVVQKRTLPKHLMKLLQKEKNLFPHLHFQTHRLK